MVSDPEKLPAVAYAHGSGKAKFSDVFPSKLPIAVYAIAAFAFILQMWAGSNYGIFRDEFYYIECAMHPDLGYVDHPPFSILKLTAWISLFGDSQTSIRVVPSLLFSLLIILTSLIAVQFGGSRMSAVIAALAVFSCPQYLGITGFYSMNSFELIFWAILTVIVAAMIKGMDKRYWMLYGIVLGFGLMNKFSIGLFAVALIVALLVSPMRKDLVNRYFIAAYMIAFVIFLPFIIWNYSNGFPTLEFMRNAALYKNVNMGIADFFTEQLLIMGPVNLLVWISGLVSLLLMKRMAEFRTFAYVFVISFLILAVQSSKPYYLAGAFIPLMAAGSVAISSTGKGLLNRFISYVMAALLIAGAALLSPLAIPVLQPEAFIEYSTALGLSPKAAERQEMGLLPQHFADRFGWKELTGIVSGAFNSLSEDEKSSVIIYADNYGEAGAVNYYGRDVGLPRAVSGHNNYWLWGPGVDSATVLIIIGGDLDGHTEVFDEVTEFGKTSNRYSMPYENNLPVYIARKPKHALKTVWKDLRKYI